MSHDLYTSQVHLKRLLTGQATPAFTSAPEAVLKTLDPAFFPGLGALNEDTHGRLQCPVRGCGRWFLMLGLHLDKRHRGLGGRHGIKSALDIPRAQSLLSRKQRDMRRDGTPLQFLEAGRRNSSTGRLGNRQQATRALSVLAETRPDGNTRISAHARNLSDSCVAQLSAKVSGLAKKVDGPLTARRFAEEYGHQTAGAVRAAFGTWNNAKALVGLTCRPGGRAEVGLVVESLRTWVETHGDLPTARMAMRPTRAPVIPSTKTIIRAFGVTTWAAAMRSAVEHLGIKSHRYSAERSA